MSFVLQESVKMDHPKGTDSDPLEGNSEWFLVREAECSDLENEEAFEELFEGSTVSDLLDDSEQVQGDSLQLFQHLEQTESERELAVLKRKLIGTPESREIEALSPRLGAVTISPNRSQNPPKRRLFETERDSGLELTINETANTSEELPEQVEGEVEGPQGAEGVNAESVPKVTRLLDVFHAKSCRVALLAKFKTAYEISFSDITRPFKSNQTCYTDWVCALFGLDECHETVLKTVVKAQCEFMHLKRIGNICLMLTRFKTHKSRNTLINLFKMTLDMPDYQMLLEPPKTNGVAAAVYWYQTGLAGKAYVDGGYPEWILRQTAITGEALQHQFALSDMIQWAYDHDYTNEAIIAYEYARLAEEDINASAWLKSNNQARYVKECAQMCRYYKQAQMLEMTMSAWIHDRCSRVKEDNGDWKPIVKFLRYQGIPFPIFVSAFTPFLKGTAKKNCIVFTGPPNTGKSVFCMSLINFLGGRVISYVNSKSQFWLQPLAYTKIGLLDDATAPCWVYMDIYLRNMLDGNPISIDLKHKAPIQLKCPPLLVTTNHDIRKEERLRYLHSRCKVFEFTEEYPFDEEGNPIYTFNDANWKSFFERTWLQLELSDHDDEGEDGAAGKAFRCSAGANTRPL